MIEVRYGTGLSGGRRDVFQRAAGRWNAVLDTALPPVSYRGERIEGIVIDATITPIDGPSGVLGQAGPTVLRPVTRLPALGVMEFDEADIRRLEEDGTFEDVILHEMGHVLGAGTLWSILGLIEGEGGPDPVFTGAAAAREYGELLGQAPAVVPVANTGGAGTRDGHWRELTFGDELMTGFLSGTDRPLSRMTIASFADLGYEVRYEAADPYVLPGDEDLMRSGVLTALRLCDLCRVDRPAPIPLGPGAFAD
ncbi:leishmanolysin-related zinc metalloendopeptidase [Pontivivens ytuae]|uniref:Peptidase n=1 Tax=Pontivivens ytuae TaxID=2789856 RepID=A0A7S9LU18_9RHOB|nr:leishmanolysin-related zinc metalloendopeptidase [Pontivivens ytuae]QPH55015.1 peptidase [Pontivivens ytuae]